MNRRFSPASQVTIASSGSARCSSRIRRRGSIGVSSERDASTSHDPRLSWASATRREPQPLSATPASFAASSNCARTAFASPSIAWATGNVQAAWRGSTSIWTIVWRSGSSSARFSNAVSVGPSLVPTARTKSASATTVLAASSPNVPKTPSESGWVSGKTPLPGGRRGDRRAEVLGEGAELGAGAARSGRRCRPRSAVARRRPASGRRPRPGRRARSGATRPGSARGTAPSRRGAASCPGRPSPRARRCGRARRPAHGGRPGRA